MQHPDHVDRARESGAGREGARRKEEGSSQGIFEREDRVQKVFRSREQRQEEKAKSRVKRKSLSSIVLYIYLLTKSFN